MDFHAMSFPYMGFQVPPIPPAMALPWSSMDRHGITMKLSWVFMALLYGVASDCHGIPMGGATGYP